MSVPVAGFTYLFLEESEVPEVRRLSRVYSTVTDADGRIIFRAEVDPDARRFVVLPASEAWATRRDARAIVDAISEIRDYITRP